MMDDIIQAAIGVRIKSAKRPWSTTDSTEKRKYIETCDSQTVMDMCLSCNAYKCIGDCKLRRELTSKTEKKGKGRRKNIRMDTILEEHEKHPEMSQKQLGELLGVTRTTIRYWFRKAGIR